MILSPFSRVFGLTKKFFIQTLMYIIREKQLKFQINVPLHLQDILADKHRLSQVLKNLFNNAIKFTDQGHIAITACQHDDYLTISIEDTGIGISKNEAKKIFEKFHQADTADNRQYF